MFLQNRDNEIFFSNSNSWWNVIYSRINNLHSSLLNQNWGSYLINTFCKHTHLIKELFMLGTKHPIQRIKCTCKLGERSWLHHLLTSDLLTINKLWQPAIYNTQSSTYQHFRACHIISCSFKQPKMLHLWGLVSHFNLLLNFVVFFLY